MATTFHVYVEGPVDRSPDSIERLATAISQKFGLPAPDLVKRMSAGRFRVKANVDRATAETYERALTEVGARVMLEEAHPTQPNQVVAPPAPAAPPPPRERRQNSAVSKPENAERSNRYSVSPPMSSARTVLPDPSRAKSPTAPPQRAAPSVPPPIASAGERSGPTTTPPAPRAAAPSLPPPTARPPASPLPPPSGSRPATSSLPPATTSRPAATFQSGLSAAYTPSSSSGSADLGALGSDALSLSALDGQDDERPAATFAPPSPGLPASIGPPPPKAAEAPKPTVEPLDLFAPPDAEDAEQAVELATDELEHRARKMSVPPVSTPTTPGQGVPTSQPLTPTRRHQLSTPIPVKGGVSAPETPRARILAGVVLSILLGFIPAHLIAESRERSAFAAIDAQVVAVQEAADTPEEHEALDAYRTTQIARKQSERRSIALTSMLIWAVVGAGLAYAWFRRVPWDRLAR